MSDKASFRYRQRAKASLKPQKEYSHTPGLDIEYVHTPREDLTSLLKFLLRLRTYHSPPAFLTIKALLNPYSYSRHGANVAGCHG